MLDMVDKQEAHQLVGVNEMLSLNLKTSADFLYIVDDDPISNCGVGWWADLFCTVLALFNYIYSLLVVASGVISATFVGQIAFNKAI